MITPSSVVGTYAAARTSFARPATSSGAPVAETSTDPPARPREGKATQADDTNLASASRTYSSTGSFRRHHPGIFVDIDY